MTRLKQQPGGNISITGSLTLVRSLLAAGVLDEIVLMVHPVVVGRGMRLFGEGEAQVPLKLVDSRTLGTGVVALTYQPVDR